MLRLDFFESGVGETIIITFPDETIGIVDAHPSTVKSRPSILELLEGKKIRFACLTHPHQDHGLDLLPVLSSKKIEEFWHTIDDITFFVENLAKTPDFRALHRNDALDVKKGWARFLLSLLNEVFEKDIPDNPLRNDLQTFNFAGAEITVGWPNRFAQREYIKTYIARLKKPKKALPDHNGISAVLILKYGDRIVLLGSDALKNSWSAVKKVFHDRGLHKARILKVPHHGALNALHLHPDKNRVSYLDLCADDCDAILFAGDCDHPDVNVKTRLKARTSLHSFFDIETQIAGADPLKLNLYGGVGVDTVPRKVISSQMTVLIQPNGTVSLTIK